MRAVELLLAGFALGALIVGRECYRWGFIAGLGKRAKGEGKAK